MSFKKFIFQILLASFIMILFSNIVFALEAKEPIKEQVITFTDYKENSKEYKKITFKQTALANCDTFLSVFFNENCVYTKKITESDLTKSYYLLPYDQINNLIPKDATDDILVTTEVEMYLKKNISPTEKLYSLNSDTFFVNPLLTKPMKLVKKSEKNIKVPIITYHEFIDTVPEVEKYSYVSTVDVFEENIKTLLANNYKFISFNDLYEYSQNAKAIPEKSIVLTFDDGYESNYIKIFPLLKKYKIPATIFVVNDLIGRKTYLTWQQAKEMQESGLVDISCHSKSHLDSTKLPVIDFLKGTLESFNNIDKFVSLKKLRVFAYPYGISNTTIRKALKDNGVQMQVVTGNEVNYSATLDLSNLKRITCCYDYTGIDIIRLIENLFVN